MSSLQITASLHPSSVALTIVNSRAYIILTATSRGMQWSNCHQKENFRQWTRILEKQPVSGQVKATNKIKRDWKILSSSTFNYQNRFLLLVRTWLKWCLPLSSIFPERCLLHRKNILPVILICLILKKRELLDIVDGPFISWSHYFVGGLGSPFHVHIHA